MQKRTAVIASCNPVKINAALGALKKMFAQYDSEIISVKVPSGVADQPMTDEETLAGAINRVNNACKAHDNADFWMGIEGGVTKIGDDLAAFAWVVVKSKDLIGKARSGAFFLPHAVTELIEQGIELGIADDIVFGKTNSKQEGGAIGLLTDNVVDRRQLYEQAVVLALVTFKNKELYKR